MSGKVKVVVSLLSAVALARGADAQDIVPIGPFGGEQSDGFETQCRPNCDPPCFECVPSRVFNDTADLCGDPHGCITSYLGHRCDIRPRGGKFFYFVSEFAKEGTFTFDMLQQRFGGYFGTVGGVADGTAIFLDGDGNEIGRTDIDIHPDCTWTWNGWEVPKGFKEVIIRGNFGDGGFVFLDDMEVGTIACNHINRLVVKCKTRRGFFNIKAKVVSDLLQGTSLTLTLDGNRPCEVRLNRRGKAKCKWKVFDVGDYRVCVSQCAEVCRQTTCSG